MTVDVRNVSFSYGKHEVLRNITFAADKGELVSVLGPNGVGKSTLFQCILGIAKGFTGTITIEGENVLRQDSRTLAKRIAYIPQSHYSAFHYSVLDMVLMGTTAQLSSFASPSKQQVEIAMWAMDKTGIANFAERDFMRISGGERQLVLIARALAQQSRVLIMDEPTANLDFGNQMRVLRQIRLLSEEGYTVIQSTHHPEQAYLFSNRILAMHDGKLVAEGSPKDIVTAELMDRLYGIDVCVESLREDAIRVCVPKVL